MEEKQPRTSQGLSEERANASICKGRLCGILCKHKSMQAEWLQMSTTLSISIMVVFQLLPLSTGLERKSMMALFRPLCAFDHGGGGLQKRNLLVFCASVCVCVCVCVGGGVNAVIPSSTGLLVITLVLRTCTRVYGVVCRVVHEPLWFHCPTLSARHFESVKSRIKNPQKHPLKVKGQMKPC